MFFYYYIFLGFIYFSSLVLVLFLIGVLLFFKERVTDDNKKADTIFRGYVKDFINNIKVIRKFDTKNLFKEKLLDITFKKVMSQNSLEQQKNIYDSYIEIVLMIFYVCTLGISVYGVLSRNIDASFLFIILLMSWYSIAPLKQITDLPSNWRISQDIFDQIKILKKSITPVNRHSAIQMSSDILFDVNLKNVTHQFANSSEFMLHNINFLAKKKEVLLIYGPSGSGKTTILNLVMGLETPTSGIIQIGYNVNVIDKKSLRNNIVYVNNLSYFECLSLYENIKLLYLDKNEQEILELLINSQLFSSADYYQYKFIKVSDLKNNDSVNFQMIINKLILFNLMPEYKNKIILIDEPIIEGEERDYSFLVRRIQKLCKDNTVIIASRYNYYQAISDRVLVLENGIIKKYFGKVVDDK